MSPTLTVHKAVDNVHRIVIITLVEGENLSGYDSGERHHWDHYYTLKQDYLMKTSDMLSSKFIRKEDCEPAHIMTIKNCSLEEVGASGDDKWVLWFNESKKGLVLNKTKIKLLEGAFGTDTDDWFGKKVRLSHDPSVMYGAERVGGIKLETPKATAKPAPTPKAAPTATKVAYPPDWAGAMEPELPPLSEEEFDDPIPSEF